MALPERHYYPLAIAAKKLKCDVDDLLHYAGIGLLELCILAPKSECSVEELENNDELVKKCFSPSINYIDKSIPNEDKKKDEDEDEDEDEDDYDKMISVIYKTVNTKLLTRYGPKSNKIGRTTITGLLAIPFFDVKNIDCSDKDFIQPNYLYLPRTKTKFTITENIEINNIYLNNELTICQEQFLITAEELTLLNKGGELIEDKRPLKAKHADNSEYFNKSPKAESKKSENLKSEFIKNLLLVKYGDKVAENPRPFLENTHSAIRRDFEEKGLIPPSGVTVSEWLK
ncbi:hypothetical protein R2S03_15040 [Hafnia alvei]|uniref:hypothetical protein n=1 Tax=Proteus vulgaris TaxID=585 RepID=UPI00299D7C53|nr:hypothetical protein [Proteus vulgaris]WOO48776.1 hypothetical protein R2S03_15040 [Hafnia alvei]WPF03242.1 hypothetical protein SB028_13875 [Proteus vulgaris]